MSHTQNLSSKSAFTRFMIGSVLTAFGTARLMRNPKSRMAQGMVVLGAMHAAEGATGYCPSKAMMGKNASKNAQGMQGISQMAQNMTGGNPMKAITNAAQNVVPEVGQLMKDFVNATSGSQSAAGSANSGGKSATSNASSSGNKSASTNQSKSASSNQSTQKSASSGSKTSTASKAATAYQDGTMPSDGMMQNIADTVIDKASKTGEAPRITH